MSNWIWIKTNWKWLTLLWFNFSLTITSAFASYLASWGIGLILYLSAIVSAGILMKWKDVPAGDSSQALIQITDEAIYEGDNGYCCCKYCGSENRNLLRHDQSGCTYPFDPRLHYPECIVTIARQSVDPQAIKFAPKEFFSYENHEDDYHEQEV